MSRIPDLREDELTPEQTRLYAEIKGPRGIVGGPFALWLRLPAVADAANRFGNALRLEGKLDRRLFELVILAIARRWGAQYEWFQHAPAALRAGLAPAIVEAIRTGTPPPFERDDERVAYDFTQELLGTHTVSAATFERARAMFGDELLIELVTVLGFYVTAAMMINAFDAPVPGGERPLPDLSLRGT